MELIPYTFRVKGFEFNSYSCLAIGVQGLRPRT